MSFRKRGKEVDLFKLPDNCSGEIVEPAKGVNTLYWWNKGDDESGWYVKAELYDVDGENIEIMVGESLQELQCRVLKNYGLRFKK